MTNYAIIPSNSISTVNVEPVPNNQNGNSFFNSSVQAYGNLTKHPFALFLLILATLSILAETNSAKGPFEIIAGTLEKFITEPDHSAFLKTLASLLLGIIKFIIKFKSHMFLYLLIVVIVIAYPEDNTFYVCSFLFLYVSVSTHSQYVLFIIIQLFFIYFNQKNNFDRLMLALIIIVMSFGTESLSTMLASK